MEEEIESPEETQDYSEDSEETLTEKLISTANKAKKSIFG